MPATRDGLARSKTVYASCVDDSQGATAVPSFARDFLSGEMMVFLARSRETVTMTEARAAATGEKASTLCDGLANVNASTGGCNSFEMSATCSFRQRYVGWGIVWLFAHGSTFR